MFLLLYFVKKESRSRSRLLFVWYQRTALIPYRKWTIFLHENVALKANESPWIIRHPAQWTWHGQNWLIWWERPTPTCPLSGLWLIYNPLPPLIPTSPPHTPSLLPAPPLPIALSLYPCHSPPAPPTSDAIRYQPGVLLSSHSDTKAAWALLLREELEEGLGVGVGRRRVCILDVPILTWPPWGYTHDKHQISLTKTAVPQRRSWHGWGGKGGIFARQRPLMVISREGGSEEETKELSSAEVGVTLQQCSVTA